MASFNQTAGFMSRPLISGESSSRQSSSSASGVTHPFQTMYSAGGANPNALNQFSNYGDYKKAFSREVDPAMGGNAWHGSNLAKNWQYNSSSPFQGAIYGRGGGYGEEEFNRQQEGNAIGSGQRLREAYGRADDSLQTDVGTMPDELYNRYKALLNDPMSVKNTPGYQFEYDQGLEAMRRSTPRLSGRRLTAAQEYGQNFADTKYGEHLGRARGGAQEEAGRFGANADVALNKNRLRSSLMTEPDKAIFNQYWGADPWASSSSSATRDQTQYAVPRKA